MAFLKLLAFVLTVFSFTLGSGAHAFSESEKIRAKKLVFRGVEYYRQHGARATFTQINDVSGPLRDGKLYLFVYNTRGFMLAHGNFPGGVGQNYLKARTQDGRLFIQERIALMKDKTEAWQQYKYWDPDARIFSEKLSFIMKVDQEYLFGAGVYSPTEK